MTHTLVATIACIMLAVIGGIKSNEGRREYNAMFVFGVAGALFVALT